MSQIFNLQRLLLLLKLEVYEKGKNQLMMGSLLTGLMLALMMPIVFVEQHGEVYVLFHALALFMVVIFGGSLYTVQVFGQYGSANTAISAIMVPASRQEKYFASLFLNLIFTVPFLLLFLLLHYKTIDYANSIAPKDMYKYQYIPKNILTYFVYLYVTTQGAVFLGSIYFRKLAYIKTAFIFCIIYLLVGGAYLMQAKYITSYPSKLVTFPFTSWEVWYYALGKNYYVGFPPAFQTLTYIFPVVLLLGMWFTAFVRLKEKQI